MQFATVAVPFVPDMRASEFDFAVQRSHKFRFKFTCRAGAPEPATENLRWASSVRGEIKRQRPRLQYIFTGHRGLLYLISHREAPARLAAEEEVFGVVMARVLQTVSPRTVSTQTVSTETLASVENHER
eukprot:1318379-Rhodomonas_salina.1